jgi:hypothetical protein
MPRFTSIFALAFALLFSSVSSAATVPIISSAGYPFVCFSGQLNTGVSQEYIEGKVLRVYFGYTSATEAEFKSNVDLEWFNSKGEPVAEGFIDVEYHHDSGYPGFMHLEPLKIKVPSGLNLLLRIGYMKKVGGSCFSSEDPLKTAYAESRVFFVAGDRQ